MKKGKCYYINLESSILRRSRIEPMIQQLNIDYERFEAIEYEPGTVGCLLSHLKLMEHICSDQENYDWYLIFEDDAAISSHYTIDYVLNILDNLDLYFQEAPLIMLGAAINALPEHPNWPYPHPKYTDFLVGEGGCNAAHAYVITKDYAETLKTEWSKQYEDCKECLKLLKEGTNTYPDLIRICNPDNDYWATLQKKDRWLVKKDLFYQLAPEGRPRIVNDEKFLEKLKN